jgi:hypothetical protein
VTCACADVAASRSAAKVAAVRIVCLMIVPFF